MKKIISAVVLVFAPFFAFAGGHSALSASGTGVRIDLKTIDEKDLRIIFFNKKLDRSKVRYSTRI